MYIEDSYEDLVDHLNHSKDIMQSNWKVWGEEGRGITRELEGISQWAF